MEVDYIVLSQYMGELIGIREVIKEIQTFVISGKRHNPKYCTHSKSSILDDIPKSKVYEDKKYWTKVSTISKMSTRTKPIALQ